jgi:hypothetical protein
MRKKSIYAIIALLYLMTTVRGYGQSINASVTGTVSDPTGALIPGVTVTAANTATGVAATTITNESGSYVFPALQPGTYKVSAELPGFQTQTFTDVQLGGAQQIRLNFTLQVAAAAGTTVEVTVAADTLLATSSNSVGTILPEYKVRDLPVQNRNVFDLVKNTPGVQSSGGYIGVMAGGRLADVNVTRDGVNVNDGRYENGAWSVVYSSPDAVEEVKVLVAPVDAETSRGSGQVSLVTRSGTNKFQGSTWWANHNSALDSNNWFNNQRGVDKSYDNRNQYGARMGGPIIKNRTFFFALFEGQRDMKKNQVAGLTLTDMAKAGIFRYWPGLDNANANNQDPSVDRFGNPVRPARMTAANIALLQDPNFPAAIGLFGSCNYKGAPVPNCKTYTDPAGQRLAPSTSPWIQETLKRMPSPNEFVGGDGLNTANIRFVRRQDGLDLTNGNGDEVNRDHYNARIDHQINSKERLSLIATKEKTWGTATQAGLRGWPTGYDGLAVKRPYVYTIQLTSTISSSMVNQLRLAKRASQNWQWGSANRGDDVGAEAKKLHPVASGVVYQVSTTGTTNLPNISNYGGFGRWREHQSPMKSIGDDLSWTVRRHAFKMGYEWRRQESNGFNDPNYTPLASLGAGANPLSLLDGTQFGGLNATPATLARNIIYDMTGQISSVNQAFGIKSAKDTTLRTSPDIPNNRHWNFQTEMEGYFKDEWKVRSNLTLNLGVHWATYLQPWEHDGVAARIVGDESALSSLRCTASPGTANFRSTCTNLIQVQLVGKNSPNPNLGVNLKGNDSNNFAPAVGLSWNLPWFGKDKTVVRAGYGMNYEGALRNFITVDSSINTVPGINLIFNGSGRTWNVPVNSFVNLTNLTLPIPLATGTPTSSPFPVPTTERSLGLTTYSFVSPYTQNWNFEIQRQLARNMTVEVRYIGSKGTKRLDNVNLNLIDALHHNKDLFDAFNIVRAGGESPLLQQMLNGASIGGVTVNSTNNTAGVVLRGNATTRAQLANGNVGAFLNSLNTSLLGGDNGSALRRNGFPENYIVDNPQYAAVNLYGNNTNSTYHALQMQFQRRLTNGFASTTSWTWSKSMGPGATPANAIDPTRRNAEKALQATDVKYQLSSNGTWQLPVGRGHYLLGGAPGFVQQVVEGWQLGGILNLQGGTPITITSVSTGTTGISTISTNAAHPNVVGAIPSNMGNITKKNNGVFYFDGFTQIPDPQFATLFPQCNTSSTACNGLVSGYSNKAIVDPKGNIILVNPQPGEVGTLGYNTLRGPGSVNFDMNLIKRFKVDEGGKTVEFRLDVINILNHPNFGDPTTGINGNNNFGQITTATGSRQFVTNLRFSF